MMRNSVILYIVFAVVLSVVIFILPKDKVVESHILYSYVPEYNMAGLGYGGKAYEDGKSSVQNFVASKPIVKSAGRTTTRVSGLSHGKAANKAVRQYKEIVLMNGVSSQQMKIKTTSSEISHSYGYYQTGTGTSYSSLKPANASRGSESGNSVGYVGVVAYNRGYDYGAVGAIGRRNAGPGGIGGDDSQPGDGSVWSDWLEGFIDENGNQYLDSELATNDLWAWWKTNNTDGPMPFDEDYTESWVNWALPYVLPIDNAWGFVLMLLAGYVVVVRMKFKRRKS